MEFNPDGSIKLPATLAKKNEDDKQRMIDTKNFEVEIGTDFRRCTDCTSLLNKYREFLDQNLIEKKGNCTFEGRRSTFCEEDCFE